MDRKFSDIMKNSKTYSYQYYSPIKKKKSINHNYLWTKAHVLLIQFFSFFLWQEYRLWRNFGLPVVRESIASKHRFPKVHGHPFGYQGFLDVSLQFSIQVWISTLISMQGHFTMDVRGTWIFTKWISMFYGYQSSITHAFIDIHLDVHWFLWISMHELALDSRSRVCFRTPATCVAHWPFPSSRMQWGCAVRWLRGISDCVASVTASSVTVGGISDGDGAPKIRTSFHVPSGREESDDNWRHGGRLFDVGVTTWLGAACNCKSTHNHFIPTNYLESPAKNKYFALEAKRFKFSQLFTVIQLVFTDFKVLSGTTKIHSFIPFTLVRVCIAPAEQSSIVTQNLWFLGLWKFLRLLIFRISNFLD